MPPKKISLKTTSQHQNQRLDQVLADWLPIALKQPLSKAKVRKLVVAGAVYLNGKRIRIASKEVFSGATVDVYLDLNRLNSDSVKKDLPFVMGKERILYEDDHIIAINKPPGLPTQPTLDEARDNLFAAVKKFLSVRAGIPVNQVYLGLHHRLDRDTSGVILFTKTGQANPGVAEMFSGHLAEKTYQALTVVNPPDERLPTWTVKNYLGRAKNGEGNSGKKNFFHSVRSGGDFAHTDFKILLEMKNALWVEAKPKTGRTHQIRVHLSEKKLSILGDETYGVNKHLAEIKIPRLMLHAVTLTFPHPIHKNRMEINCPLPEDFKKCLAALQKGSPNS